MRAMLLLPLGGCLSRDELFGEWDLALQRVTHGEETLDRPDSGFVNFGSREDPVSHAWTWLYDPDERDFYAQLDPPVLVGSALSTDLDDPLPITLDYAGMALPFVPEERDREVWLVLAPGGTWVGDPIGIELLLVRP